MWACYFLTGRFSRDLAGFVADWMLLEIVPGRPGVFDMDHHRRLAGAVPAPMGTVVSESVAFPEDPYNVQQAFAIGQGPTDRRGVFADSYRLGYRGSLPADFKLVMEQTYSVRSDAVFDAVLLARPGRPSGPPPATMQAKNRVTYEADYPNLRILLQSSDGAGGWRYQWSDSSTRVSIARP